MFGRTEAVLLYSAESLITKGYSRTARHAGGGASMRRLLVPLIVLWRCCPRRAAGGHGPGFHSAATGRLPPRRSGPMRGSSCRSPRWIEPGLHASAGTNGRTAASGPASSSRDDAWECTSRDNHIYDPCFENPWHCEDHPGDLACITSPFDKKSFCSPSTGRWSGKRVAGRGSWRSNFGAWELPWALELANGEQCVLLSEVAGVMAGESVYYSCADGDRSWAI